MTLDRQIKKMQNDLANQINPENSKTYCNKGKIKSQNIAIKFVNLNRLEQILQRYDYAIQKNPKDAETYNDKNQIFKEQFPQQKAQQFHDYAIQKNPYYYEAFINKAITLDQLNWYEQAILCHDSAIQINPQLYIAFFNSAKKLVKLHRLQEAIYSLIMQLKYTLNFMMHTKTKVKFQKQLILVSILYLLIWYYNIMIFQFKKLQKLLQLIIIKQIYQKYESIGRSFTVLWQCYLNKLQILQAIINKRMVLNYFNKNVDALQNYDNVIQKSLEQVKVQYSQIFIYIIKKTTKSNKLDRFEECEHYSDHQHQLLTGFEDNLTNSNFWLRNAYKMLKQVSQYQSIQNN